MRYGVLHAVVLICGCSSFGIRTSTQVPYLQTGDNCTINVYMDGSIDGAGVESNVPIDKITASLRTAIGGGASSVVGEDPTEAAEAPPSSNGTTPRTDEGP